MLDLGKSGSMRALPRREQDGIGLSRTSGPVDNTQSQEFSGNGQMEQPET